MLRRDVVARVLDDAFADGEGEIETAEGGIPLFKPGDNAQRVQVVIEAEAVWLEEAVERFLSRVAEGRVPDVVDERQASVSCTLRSRAVAKVARDLGDFKRVSEAAAEVVARAASRCAREHLSLSSEASKGACVQNAGAVACERGAISVRRLGVRALGKGVEIRHRDSRIESKRGLCITAHGHVWLYRNSAVMMPRLTEMRRCITVVREPSHQASAWAAIHFSCSLR